MLAEMAVRPPMEEYDVFREISARLTCTDPRCLNRRKGVSFTYCYVHPTSKKHQLVPPADINAWKVAIGDRRATLDNPPIELFDKWRANQEAEQGKLADAPDNPGGRSGGRYASGRSGNTTQNVNINLGHIAGSSFLPGVQNSSTQGGDLEPQLPPLPASSRTPASFKLPIRPSSPIPPFNGDVLIHFLEEFNQQYFARNPTSSAAMAKVIEMARYGDWNFEDLQGQSTGWFVKIGLAKHWIPVLLGEAKRYCKEAGPGNPDATAETGDGFNEAEETGDTSDNADDEDEANEIDEYTTGDDGAGGDNGVAAILTEMRSRAMEPATGSRCIPVIAFFPIC